WYGILIAAGMLIAVMISYHRAPIFDIKPDDAFDIALIMLPVGVIGARIYYVIFNWDYYAGDFLKIINIRNGGLAIHGGLIFGVLAVVLMCRRRKISFLNLLDLYFPTVALAQAIGRWGNFFNNEAHGTETDLPWAVIIDGKGYHPTFLYESIWCFLIFIVLLRLSRRRRFVGQITFLYGILYSIERFFVEGLRTDSLMIGPFRQAQIISVCILIACLTLYAILSRRQQNAAAGIDDTDSKDIGE
ncbi:MAG: prolipoprotein diacylglyceryl transferase, partial [Mogibacterium sp.]|nr:prolipoprotein diacylglyceryl transferase [Mogibacterium sp.]